MNQELLENIGGVVAILGSLFLLLGSLGITRMPDTYTRNRRPWEAYYRSRACFSFTPTGPENS
jgi:hypothetical protein